MSSAKSNSCAFLPFFKNAQKHKKKYLKGAFLLHFPSKNVWSGGERIQNALLVGAINEHLGSEHNGGLMKLSEIDKHLAKIRKEADAIMEEVATLERYAEGEKVSEKDAKTVRTLTRKMDKEFP